MGAAFQTPRQCSAEAIQRILSSHDRPIIEATASALPGRKGSEWLEAFDHLPPLMTILEVMRKLDLFHETSLGKYLGMVLENKLRTHFFSTLSPLRSRGLNQSPKPNG